MIQLSFLITAFYVKVHVSCNSKLKMSTKTREAQIGSGGTLTGDMNLSIMFQELGKKLGWNEHDDLDAAIQVYCTVM